MPGRNQRAAVATDAWSGAIEYTYTEVSKLSKYEARGMVHIVADRAQWSGLAARMEDHSAKGCPSVFYARSAGGGKSDLVVIDYTSQNPVRGIVMPNATASAANQSRNAILTIFPNRYGLAIELPLKGSGKYTGGGPACPGYNDHLIISDADITLNDTADGKFDVDNPNRISGTKITQPFPGASLNMKWVFTRFNPGR